MGMVWYNPSGIENILSPSYVKKNGGKVTYDSSDKYKFHVLKFDGNAQVFKESECDLYYMDTSLTLNQTSRHLHPSCILGRRPLTWTITKSWC